MFESRKIFCSPTHERTESLIAQIPGSEFYSIINHPNTKPGWNEQFAKIPDNYHLYDLSAPPFHINGDFVLSQNKFGQYQFLSSIAHTFRLPLISLEHTCPMPNWKPDAVQNAAKMRGHKNVFISEWSVGVWGFNPNDPSVEVVHHGVDSEVFCPKDNPKENRILSIVNDFVNRDLPCGFNKWRRVTQNLPVKLRGDTKGLSTACSDINELVEEYNSSTVFLNTSQFSPIPTVLLEAASCGMACVTTANCAIPEYFTHEHNCLMSNDENELRKFCEHLLNNPKDREELGKNARLTIEQKFNTKNFIEKWDTILQI